MSSSVVKHCIRSRLLVPCAMLIVGCSLAAQPSCEYAPLGVIAFNSVRQGNANIYCVNADGTNLRRLTSGETRDSEPCWSPDGLRLVFASDRDGDLEIYTIGVDGSDLTRLTDNDVDDLLPAWSPDGLWIAFVSYRDADAEIYVMQTDGSCAVRITDNPGDDMYPAWRPIGAGAENAG